MAGFAPERESLGVDRLPLQAALPMNLIGIKTFAQSRAFCSMASSA